MQTETRWETICQLEGRFQAIWDAIHQNLQRALTVAITHATVAAAYAEYRPLAESARRIFVTLERDLIAEEAHSWNN